MNTGHSLTTDEWITKLEKKQAISIEREDWVKVRSYQLKMDNARGVTPRGKIGSLIASYTATLEKLPNRKQRRIDIQGKPQTAKDQIARNEAITTQKQAQDPRKNVDETTLKKINSAKKDLHEFLKKSDKASVIWGSGVGTDDSIIIYSSEKLEELPSTHRGYVVVNRIGTLPEAQEILK